MILASTVYILVALSIGLLISVKTRSQLVANQLRCWSPTCPHCCCRTSFFPQQKHAGGAPGVSKLVPATYYIDISITTDFTCGTFRFRSSGRASSCSP